MDSGVSASSGVEKKEWSGATIVKSAASGSSRFLVVIALIWNLASIPAAYLFYLQFMQLGQYKAIVILLIPLIGFLLTSWVVHARRAWRSIGPVSLQLDPFPGAIGGHIGGWIDVPEHFNPDACVIVTVSCIQVSQFGKDHQLRVQEKLCWQEQGLAHVAKGSEAMRLLFRFRVPTHLPESDQSGEPITVWRLRVSGEVDDGLQMEREFEIPAFRTSETSSRQSFTETAKANGDWAQHKRLLADLMDVQQLDDDRIQVDYPYGRSRSSAILYLSIGVLLLLAVCTMLWLAPMIVKSAVTAVAIGCILWAIYLQGNRVCVEISPDGIRGRRYLLGVPLGTRYLPAERFSGFAAKPMNSLTLSRQLISQYRLYAISDDAEKIVIAENLKGRGQLHAVEQWFVSRLPFEVISRSV